MMFWIGGIWIEFREIVKKIRYVRKFIKRLNEKKKRKKKEIGKGGLVECWIGIVREEDLKKFKEGMNIVEKELDNWIVELGIDEKDEKFNRREKKLKIDKERKKKDKRELERGEGKKGCIGKMILKILGDKK